MGDNLERLVSLRLSIRGHTALPALHRAVSRPRDFRFTTVISQHHDLELIESDLAMI